MAIFEPYRSYAWSFLLHLLTGWGVPEGDQAIVAGWLIFMLASVMLALLSMVLRSSSWKHARRQRRIDRCDEPAYRNNTTQQRLQQTHVRR